MLIADKYILHLLLCFICCQDRSELSTIVITCLYLNLSSDGTGDRAIGFLCENKSCRISQSFKFSVESYVMWEGGKMANLYNHGRQYCGRKVEERLGMCLGNPSAIIGSPSRGQNMRLWKWQPCHHYLFISMIQLSGETGRGKHSECETQESNSHQSGAFQ